MATTKEGLIQEVREYCDQPVLSFVEKVGLDGALESITFVLKLTPSTWNQVGGTKGKSR